MPCQESLGELKEFSVYSSPTFLLSRDEDGYINLIDDNKKLSLNVSKIEGDSKSLVKTFS